MTRKRTIGIALAVIVLITAVVVVTLIYRSDRTEATPLTFATSPKEVHVTVNGSDHGTVESGETITVSLGPEATIQLSQDGFAAHDEHLAIDHGQENLVTAELQPETPQASELLEQERQAKEEREATEHYLQETEIVYDQYRILEDLPQHGESYSAYQGLASLDDHDFGIYLHLYTGYEDHGRQQFNTWLKTNNYDADDYDIIEEIKNEEPPQALSQQPSHKQLQDTDPAEVSIPTDITAEGLDVDDLAMLFATVSTTWDTAEDHHHTDGLKRAKSLMTSPAQDKIFTPLNPTVSPTWRKAATMGARSLSWVTFYNNDTIGEQHNIDIDICWAWVTDSKEVLYEGPRTLELSMDDTVSGPRVTSFIYDDPDPFVDQTNSPCNMK